MASGISAVSASSLIITSLANSAVSSTPPAKVANREDSVQLSAAAQKILGSPSFGSEGESTVQELVRAAAAGDSGALSLLTVI